MSLLRLRHKKDKKHRKKFDSYSVNHLDRFVDDQQSDPLDNQTLTVLCLSFSFIDLVKFRTEVEKLEVIKEPFLGNLKPPEDLSRKKMTLGSNPCINLKFDTCQRVLSNMYSVDFEFHSVLFLVNYMHPFLKSQLRLALETFVDSRFFDLSTPLIFLSIYPEQDCSTFCKSLRSEFGFDDDNFIYFKYDTEESSLKKKQNILSDVFDCVELRTAQNIDYNNWQVLRI